DFTKRWSSYYAPSYVVTVKPNTEDDVAKIVTYAANSQTPFLSTGGGHGFTITLGKLHTGIQLDLSKLKHVIVDAKANTLTVGGAVRFRDVVEPLGWARKELPIGSEPCAGMVGATLGGGVGRYNGIHGMLLDSLLNVKMVTADGKIITASETVNKDLFWAIRGAGFNFGTILEATYSIYDETAPLVLNADFLFAPNASRAILEFFKTFENKLPAKLSFVLLAGYAPDLGGSFIIVNAIYAGPHAEGENYLQPLLKASPRRSNLTMITW
ncbi:FAD-binding domain-containing protein, partial [Melanomma pulvis-pyrius CBS 109.77]